MVLEVGMFTATLDIHLISHEVMFLFIVVIQNY